MGIQEAIHYAVPMIGVPLFGDQFLNTKANVRRGIAKMVDIETITEEMLTTAIKDVLDNPEYK